MMKEILLVLGLFIVSLYVGYRCGYDEGINTPMEVHKNVFVQVYDTERNEPVLECVLEKDRPFMTWQYPYPIKMRGFSLTMVTADDEQTANKDAREVREQAGWVFNY